MEITCHYEGFRGTFIEFQITEISCSTDKAVWLSGLKHWQKDSIFLRANDDWQHEVFNEFFIDGWWYRANQIEQQTAVELAFALRQAEGNNALSDWILRNLKAGTYLNALGV